MNAQNDSAIQRFAKDVPGLVFYYTVFPDGSDKIEILNDHAPLIWGMTKEQAEQDREKVWGMIHAADLETMKASVARSASDLSHWELQWRVFDESGSKKWLYGRGTPSARPDGSTRWLTFVFDITARIQAETEAATATDQLAVAIEAIPDGFALFDEAERLVTCNSAFRRIYARSKAVLIKGTTFEGILRAGLKLGEFNIPQEQHNQWIIDRLKNFRRASTVEEVRHADGTWLRVFERPTSNGGRVAFSIDITRTKNRQTELESAALTDALTGLLNRHGLNERIKHLPDLTAENGRAAILHLDLDKFKVVNDSQGHAAGDFMLTNIGKRLLSIAPENALIARPGGDEFVIVLPDAGADVEVHRFAENLRAAIAVPAKYKGRICQVGASIGISFWCQIENLAVEQALLDADTALIQAKWMGRNRSLIFKENMRNQALQTAQLASELKFGLKKGAFVPYFQPQIAFPDKKVFGIEAFARWIRPDGKVAPASTFLQIAEETGLVMGIDRQMIDLSLDALKHLRDGGLEKTTLGLNLSSTLFRMPALGEMLSEAADQRGLPHQQIYIKIMESKLPENLSDSIAENMRALAQAGFRIELGDFGTGPMALANLRQFPVHRIKIDRSVTKSVVDDPAMRAITEGIHNLCRRMKIDTIAEGIESDAEARALEKIGFRLYQGFHFARPMGFSELLEWLQDTGNLPAQPAPKERKAQGRT